MRGSWQNEANPGRLRCDCPAREQELARIGSTHRRAFQTEWQPVLFPSEASLDLQIAVSINCRSRPPLKRESPARPGNERWSVGIRAPGACRGASRVPARAGTHGGVQVVDVDRLLDRAEAEVVGLDHGGPGTHTVQVAGLRTATLAMGSDERQTPIAPKGHGRQGARPLCQPAIRWPSGLVASLRVESLPTSVCRPRVCHLGKCQGRPSRFAIGSADGHHAAWMQEMGTNSPDEQAPALALTESRVSRPAGFASGQGNT